MIYPERVIKNLIRIGGRAIISFPNFGYWKVRGGFLFSGRMPKNKILPYEWHNTPNIHLCSFKDFYDFCKVKNILVKKFYCLNKYGDEISNKFLVNLLTYQVIFCVSQK